MPCLARAPQPPLELRQVRVPGARATEQSNEPAQRTSVRVWLCVRAMFSPGACSLWLVSCAHALTPTCSRCRAQLEPRPGIGRAGSSGPTPAVYGGGQLVVSSEAKVCRG